MVTTRRASGIISSTYEPAVGGVDVLERPVSYAENAETVCQTRDACTEEEALRRRNNLDRLLNYDRYSDTIEQINQAQQVENAQVTSSVLNDEDIRPTSTTMQFGEDIDFSREMNRLNESESAEQTYHLNKKGKIVVLLYSLVVAVILALIVINTGVLASLSNTSSAKAEELSSAMAQYESLKGELDTLTNPNTIIEKAQQDYNMVFPN